MSLSDLLKRALALSVDECAALANTLLDSLDGVAARQLLHRRQYNERS